MRSGLKFVCGDTTAPDRLASIPVPGSPTGSETEILRFPLERRRPAEMIGGDRHQLAAADCSPGMALSRPERSVERRAASRRSGSLYLIYIKQQILRAGSGKTPLLFPAGAGDLAEAPHGANI
jgi:hypothetical protein